MYLCIYVYIFFFFISFFFPSSSFPHSCISSPSLFLFFIFIYFCFVIFSPYSFYSYSFKKIELQKGVFQETSQIWIGNFKSRSNFKRGRDLKEAWFELELKASLRVEVSIRFDVKKPFFGGFLQELSSLFCVLSMCSSWLYCVGFKKLCAWGGYKIDWFGKLKSLKSHLFWSIYNAPLFSCLLYPYQIPFLYIFSFYSLFEYYKMNVNYVRVCFHNLCSY